MFKVIVAYLFVVLATIFGFKANAKDLTNRLGVGYSNQFSTDLPSLAVRYYPNPDLNVVAALGVDTEDTNSRFGLKVKLNKIIGDGFKEDNMNFYMGSGIGLISKEVSGSSETGFELSGYVGGEFFITGLDSLAFIFEAGIAVSSVANEVRFRTFGDHPLRGGIVFYF